MRVILKMENLKAMVFFITQTVPGTRVNGRPTNAMDKEL
jgi:hypothetical protein